jgi:hypothetical protein
MHRMRTRWRSSDGAGTHQATGLANGPDAPPKATGRTARGHKDAL